MLFLLRYFVRLGEHDFNRTDDGIHQDIVVDHAVKHEHHEPNLKFHDIGIVHLTRDIEFSGKNLKSFICSIAKPSTIVYVLIFARQN